MAKKSAAKAGKKSKATKRKRRKAAPKTASGKVGGAYRVVVDTFTGTGRMRRKMEQPGTDETE
jgi:hypothetical protein